VHAATYQFGLKAITMRWAVYLRGSSPFDFFVRENAKGKMKNKISKLFLNYSDIGKLFLMLPERCGIFFGAQIRWGDFYVSCELSGQNS